MAAGCVSVGALSTIVIAAVWVLGITIAFHQDKLSKLRLKIKWAQIDLDHEKKKVAAFEKLNEELREAARLARQSTTTARSAQAATKRELDALRAKLRSL